MSASVRTWEGSRSEKQAVELKLGTLLPDCSPFVKCA